VRINRFTSAASISVILVQHWSEPLGVRIWP